MATLVVLTLGLTSCVVMGTGAREELDAELERLARQVQIAEQLESSARAEAAEHRAEAERLGGDLEDARGEIRELKRLTGRLEVTIGALTAEVGAAISNYQLTLRTFDEQIREAQANLHGTVSERLCSLQKDHPHRRLDVDAAVDEIVANGADIQAALVELPPLIFLDMEALAEVRDECFLEANLMTPKQDGFYLVGVEIGAGMWRSTGRGGACYWARRDERQRIIASYFGPAGGTVTIEPSDFEVQFERCGTVEPLGA
ncbi:MAG: hypothetical protein ACE5MI_02440 [Acidimicrobiia bacterium]